MPTEQNSPDESFWHGDEQDITREAAIVPPVDAESGYGFGVAAVIDFDHQEVLPITKRLRDLEIERRIAAFMRAELGPVQIDCGPRGCRTEVDEVDEDSCVLALVVGKRFLVPDAAFIKEKIVSLRVPIPRNMQERRGVEVIFDQVAWVPWLGV